MIFVALPPFNLILLLLCCIYFCGYDCCADDLLLLIGHLFAAMLPEFGHIEQYLAPGPQIQFFPCPCTYCCVFRHWIGMDG
jgi:hypothetical protein